MSPVFLHLQRKFNELPLPAVKKSMHWTFNEDIKKLSPEFYSKIIPLHPALNMEYSILCHQLRHSLSAPDQVGPTQLTQQLAAALTLAELLEHTHLNYLIVPREVARLRRQKSVFKELLLELADIRFESQRVTIKAVYVGWSLSRQVRDYTANINWYRLLVTRSKRVLNCIDLLGTGSESYRSFISSLDRYTNPLFAVVSWCFFIPRFATNLFLMAKHTIPGSWMDEDEKGLGWFSRFMAQLDRRGFELGNDVVWVSVGLINAFALVGALAPFAIYLTLFAFAYDIANASLRACIELNRLFTLRTEYVQLLQQAVTEEDKKAILAYLHHIDQRISFEKQRLAINLAGAVSVFLAMSLSLPFIAISPIIPLIGAILLIVIWVASYIATTQLEHYRPNDAVEKPSNLTKLGFFAKPAEHREELSKDLEPLPADMLCY